MNIKDILFYGTIVFSIVATCISYVLGRKKSVKSNSKNSTTNTQTLSQIIEKIPQYMISAEQFFEPLINKGGKLKLSQVLSSLKVDCLENGVKYDENMFKNIINRFIDFSKTVNTKNTEEVNVQLSEQYEKEKLEIIKKENEDEDKYKILKNKKVGD